MPFWAKDPLHQELEAELARLGTVPDPDDIYPVLVEKVRSRSGNKTATVSGRIFNYLPLRWEGDAEGALTALRALPDGAGPPQVWSALYPTSEELTVWKELDRVGVTERRIAQSQGDEILDDDLSNRPHCVGVDFEYEPARVLLLDWMLPRYADLGRGQVSRVTGQIRRQWSGTVQQALDRIDPMRDDSSLDAFWAQFPDAEEPTGSGTL